MENNYAPDYYDNRFEENKRPGFLTFLCVLTFIGSGIVLLVYLITPVFVPTVLEMMRNSSATLPPNSLDLYEQMAITPVWKFYMLALFSATAILGAIYMMKMKKIGFHIYTISQLAQMATGHFLIGGNYKVSYFSLFITALFIGLYAIYYKKFTNLEEERADER
jgi:hypothetical protein